MLNRCRDLSCLISIPCACPPAVLMDPLVLLGVCGCIVVAIANGANDIANSVGTSYGAGALTMRQAILFGSIAEATGAMTLGSFVAKTISKGVIDPAGYAADGCQGVMLYAVGMLCVLVGTGSTTLLATLYGLPISASHGVIGGLIAVGFASKGASSLGVDPIVQTVVAWVASPVLGGITSAMIHAVIMKSVHSAPSPPLRSEQLQPVFIAATVAVAVAFIVVTGPSVVRIRPFSLALVASALAGCGVAAATVAVRRLRGGGETAEERSAAGHKRMVDENGVEAGGAISDGEVGDGVEMKPLPSPDPVTVAKHRAYGESPGGMSPGDAAVVAATAPVEAPFVPLLIGSALTVAFAHGANDLGNSIGPLAAIIAATSGGERGRGGEGKWGGDAHSVGVSRPTLPALRPRHCPPCHLPAQPARSAQPAQPAQPAHAARAARAAQATSSVIQRSPRGCSHSARLASSRASCCSAGAQSRPWEARSRPSRRPAPTPSRWGPPWLCSRARCSVSPSRRPTASSAPSSASASPAAVSRRGGRRHHSTSGVGATRGLETAREARIASVALDPLEPSTPTPAHVHVHVHAHLPSSAARLVRFHRRR